MRRRWFLFFRFIIIIHVFIFELRNAHRRTHAVTHTKIEYVCIYPVDAALGTIKTHILRTSIAFVVVVIVVDVDWQQSEASITSFALPCDT